VNPVHKAGELVRVSLEGRTVDAVVVLASGDGRSLYVTFEAILGGYAGGMPVIWRDGAFTDFHHRAVEIERVGP